MSKLLNKRKLPIKTIGLAVTAVMLVVAGVMGTLQYQAFISSIKAEGVAEYKLNSCDKYNDKKVEWLECDE